MEKRNLNVLLHVLIDLKTKKLIDKLEKRLKVSRAEVVRRAIEYFENQLEGK